MSSSPKLSIDGVYATLGLVERVPCHIRWPTGYWLHIRGGNRGVIFVNKDLITVYDIFHGYHFLTPRNVKSIKTRLDGRLELQLNHADYPKSCILRLDEELQQDLSNWATRDEAIVAQDIADLDHQLGGKTIYYQLTRLILALLILCGAIAAANQT